MKVNSTSKGFTAGDRQIALIEKKFAKLSKFFPEDTVADVTMGYKKNRQTMEAMIPVKGMIFRSEYTDTDMNVRYTFLYHGSIHASGQTDCP